jgi:hypothetical protein
MSGRLSLSARKPAASLALSRSASASPSIRARHLRSWLIVAAIVAPISALLGPASLAAPAGRGLLPSGGELSTGPSVVVKARVVCSQTRQGNQLLTRYCPDGYECVGADKCRPGAGIIRQQEAERVARERAAREQAARELAARAAQEAKERAAREAREKAERAAREKLAREREAKEKAARAAQEKLAREREAKEKAERAAKEKLAREQAARELAAKAAREKAEQAAREKLAREREAKEKAERAAKEKLAREQAAREQAAKVAREKAERLAQEKLAREREAKDRAARDQAAQAAARDKAARDQAARDQAAAQAAARDKAARDQAAREQAARELAAREQAAGVATREQAARDEAARKAAAAEAARRALEGTRSPNRPPDSAAVPGQEANKPPAGQASVPAGPARTGTIGAFSHPPPVPLGELRKSDEEASKIARKPFDDAGETPKFVFPPRRSQRPIPEKLKTDERWLALQAQRNKLETEQRSLDTDIKNLEGDYAKADRAAKGDLAVQMVEKRIEREKKQQALNKVTFDEDEMINQSVEVVDKPEEGKSDKPAPSAEGNPDKPASPEEAQPQPTPRKPSTAERRPRRSSDIIVPSPN